MTREKEIYKVTLVGSAGNIALMTFKFIAGVLGNSAAMIADAVHSMSDFITDIMVIVFPDFDTLKKCFCNTLRI
jgi:divalent metal cation (Fe/Co/Zn/Cd) transporter